MLYSLPLDLAGLKTLAAHEGSEKTAYQKSLPETPPPVADEGDGATPYFVPLPSLGDQVVCRESDGKRDCYSEQLRRPKKAPTRDLPGTWPCTNSPVAGLQDLQGEAEDTSPGSFEKRTPGSTELDLDSPGDMVARRVKSLDFSSIILRDFPTAPRPLCPICLERIEAQEKYTLATCRHAFHLSCVQRWAKTQRCNGRGPSCPMCRAPADKLIARVTDGETPHMDWADPLVMIPALEFPESQECDVWLACPCHYGGIFAWPFAAFISLWVCILTYGISVLAFAWLVVITMFRCLFPCKSITSMPDHRREAGLSWLLDLCTAPALAVLEAVTVLALQTTYLIQLWVLFVFRMLTCRVSWLDAAKDTSAPLANWVGIAVRETAVSILLRSGCDI